MYMSIVPPLSPCFPLTPSLSPSLPLTHPLLHPLPLSVCLRVMRGFVDDCGRVERSHARCERHWGAGQGARASGGGQGDSINSTKD